MGCQLKKSTGVVEQQIPPYSNLSNGQQNQQLFNWSNFSFAIHTAELFI